MRRFVAVVVAAAASAGAGPASAAGPNALVVLPPGNGNTITLGAFAKNQASGDCADLGPNVCDQREMYKGWRFRNGPLSPDPSQVPGAVTREQPAPGITIVSDSAGVPHVFADGPDEQTIEERLSYGVGYAQAEQRLFQMEVLRRAAEGRLSDLLGPDYLTMDEITRRDSETPAERQAQIDAADPGTRRSLQAYADGVSAVIQRDTLDPSRMPAGFSLTQDLPIDPWTASDTVAVGILETKNVAESAGNELGYGALARRLSARYGVQRAVGILDDLQLTGDPDTPTSVPSGQPATRTSDGLRYDYLDYSRADTARRIAALGPSVEPADSAMLNGQQAEKDAVVRLGLPVFGSNAWAIAPSRSATGHALLWGAPQVGYYAPPVLDEIETEGGDFHVRGASVPGGGPEVAIGYTPHTAWSITTAQDDQVDTYADRIRAAQGGGYEYWWRGAWHPVEQRTETIRSRTQTPDLPLTGTLAPPVYTEHSYTVYRTLHGPQDHPLPCVVVYLDPNAGVSYCKVRAFWGSELASGRAIVDATKATDLSGFDAAVRRNTAGFNFVYADDTGNIAYWHTGRIPVRAPGVDPRLPAPGDGSFDWRGFLDPSQWPSVVNPAQGWLASWNNKPQRSWLDSGDGTLWGAYQRVREPMSLLAGAGTLDQTSLWQVARRTGELDLRAALGFKPFLTDLAGRSDLTPIERAAVAQVSAWDGTAFYPDGAERDSGGTETGKVAGAGFPILSAWFHALESKVAAPVFGPVVGGSDAAAGLRAFTRTPQTTSPEFEFFDDYDAFLYSVLSGRAHAAGYLGGASAADISRAALDQAIGELGKDQGDDPSKWRSPMPQIQFESLDVSDVPPIPWENRGTWGQAVAFGG